MDELLPESSLPSLESAGTLTIPKRRWRIAWLLGLGVLVNYFDRVNLSVSHGALTTTFGVSDITFGYLLGAYNWTYALCQLPIGVVLDKFGVRRVGRISTFVWSLASFCASVAPGIPSLFAARLLLGVGEAQIAVGGRGVEAPQKFRAIPVGEMTRVGLRVLKARQELQPEL